jgi:hypothetical protein
VVEVAVVLVPAVVNQDNLQVQQLVVMVQLDQ